jgi:hypothetical protein
MQNIIAVCHVETYFLSFQFQQVVLLLVGCKNDIVTEPSDWQGQNGVCFVMVYNEEANVALEGHEEKRTGEIIVQNSCSFVSEKAAKQNIFMSDHLLLSSIMLALVGGKG